MASILYADIALRPDPPGRGGDGRPAAAPTAADTIGDLVPMHSGDPIHTRSNVAISLFGSASDAIGCALAVQARVAERNRTRNGAPRLTARLCVHRVEGGSPGAVSESTLQLASSIGALTPAGRVFVSRPVYLEARTGRSCAFIPLGKEHFSGRPEPTEIFEAISLAGKGWILSVPPAASSESRSPALDEQQAPAPIRAIVSSSVVVWVQVAACAALFFAFNRPLSTLLTPMQLLDSIFHLAGMSLFGVSGSESAAAVGGLVMSLTMPGVAAVYFIRERKPSLARWSIFWIGQSVMSVGTSLGAATDPESFAAAQRDGLVDTLGAFGAAASAPHVAQFAIAAGCLLIAMSVVAAFGFAGRKA